MPLSHMQAQPISEHWCRQVTASESPVPLLTARCLHRRDPSSAHGNKFVVTCTVDSNMAAAAASATFEQQEVEASPSHWCWPK